jgi:hypothetical protein
VTRWILGILAGLLLAGLAVAALTRLVGRRGSRAGVLVTVLAQWLAAYVLWNFAGGLAARHGILAWYDGTLFALLALAGGIWQYRTEVRQGRERGLVVFLGGQLLWATVLLVQNGAFSR